MKNGLSGKFPEVRLYRDSVGARSSIAEMEYHTSQQLRCDMSVASESTGSLAQSASRPRVLAQQVRDRRFYLAMALASTLLVFLAFARTFYLKSYFSTPPLDPLVVLHGFVFTTWMLFFIGQTALIATGRPIAPPAIGLRRRNLRFDYDHSWVDGSLSGREARSPCRRTRCRNHVSDFTR